ncbi:MAG: Gfo/Idh/MocA family oxidoreductase [Candidatus Dormibacteraeota bacterium]|nr:Gfo/Idh/MocA family oxidoreductase [Candidatus Dormibacteraeota bacterium]
MAERRLGVGVIGCGGIARLAHLPNLKRNPRARLVAVADINEESARRAAEEFGAEVAYTDYHDLLANPDVEAVTVTTWPSAHAEAVIAAAKAGKHILCEKPIAPTLQEADAMVDAAEKAGVKFTMGYQSRFGAQLPLLKEILDEGLLGRPMGMTQIGVGPSRHRVPWFLQHRYAGGGVLMDWGIYTAHTILWLMGPVESVYATTAIFRKEVQVGGRAGSPAVMVHDIDVEDTVSAHLKFRSGAMGSWYAAWAVAAAHGYMSIDGADGSVVSERGGGALRLFSRRLDDPEYLSGGWRQLPLVEPPLVEVHYRKLAHLIDSVLDDTPLQLTGADGRDALELVLAVYRSAETGLPVTLPLSRTAAGEQTSGAEAAAL